MNRPPLHLANEAYATQLPWLLWLNELMQNTDSQVITTSWPSSADALHPLTERGEVLLSVSDSAGESVLLWFEDVLVRVNLFRGKLDCLVAAKSSPQAERAVEQVRELIPERVPDEATQRVPLCTWYFSTNSGGIARMGEIDVPTWKGIEHNYTESTRAGLERLMLGFEPGEGGKLILWHGPPGTGKTYAIRALAWEWRSWAEFHFVTDPEVFFGKEPGYMMELVLGATEPARKLRGRFNKKDRWMVLVLEDTGELLAPDAKERMGQGLSRLLNLGDGLLGQGLKLLVLVTTNEPLDRVHPAVARPGRCAAKVSFAPLSEHEIVDWFAIQGAEVPAALQGQEATLATAHAALVGRELEKVKIVGFAG